MKDWLKLWTSLRTDRTWITASPEAAKVWVHCLLCARQSKKGDIPGPEDVGFELRMEDADAHKAYSWLLSKGWLEKGSDGVWCIPKFGYWQGDDEQRLKWKDQKKAQRSADVQTCPQMSADVRADNSCPQMSAPRGEERRREEKREELPPNGGLSDSTEPDHKPALKLESKKSPKAPSDPNVRTVFGLWQVLFFHGDAKLTDERRTKIAARLGEYGVDDCCRSLLGYRIDDWDERFGGGLQTHDLGVLFRNGSQLEKGLAMYKADEANALKYCPPHLAVRVALSWANLVKSGRIQEGLKVSPELWAVFSGEHREGYAPDMPEILVRVMRQQLEGNLSAPTPDETAIIARLRGSQNG